MESTKDREKVIELLAKHEEAIGRLYAEYADKFPEQHAIWVKLSDEEHQHAEWLRGLDPAIKKGSVTFGKGRFDVDSIDKSLAWVTFQTGKAERGDISMDEALMVAMDLENALIENKCFEVFEEDPPEFKKVLRLLADATEKHRTTVRNAWKRSRESRE
jgi:hypothetical protein